MPRLWRPTLLIRFFLLLCLFVGVVLIFKKFENKPEVRRNTNVKRTHAKHDSYNKMLGSSFQKKLDGVLSYNGPIPGKPRDIPNHVTSDKERGQKDEWHKQADKTTGKKSWKKHVDTKQYEHKPGAGPFRNKEKLLAPKGKLPAAAASKPLSTKTPPTGNRRGGKQRTRNTTWKPKYKDPETPKEAHLDNKNAKITNTNKGNFVKPDKKWPKDKKTDKNTGRKPYLPDVKTTSTDMKDKTWKPEWNKKEHVEKTVQKGKSGGSAGISTKTVIKKLNAGNYKVISTKRIPLTKGNAGYQKKGKAKGTWKKV